MATTIDTLFKPTILTTDTGSIALFRSRVEIDMLEVHRLDGGHNINLGMVFVGMPGFSLNPKVNDDERAILQRHFDEIQTLRRINQKADELDEWAAQLFKSGLFSQEARAELKRCAKTLRGILKEHGHKLYLFGSLNFGVENHRILPCLMKSKRVEMSTP